MHAVMSLILWVGVLFLKKAIILFVFLIPPFFFGDLFILFSSFPVRIFLRRFFGGVKSLSFSCSAFPEVFFFFSFSPLFLEKNFCWCCLETITVFDQMALFRLADGCCCFTGKSVIVVFFARFDPRDLILYRESDHFTREVLAKTRSNILCCCILSGNMTSVFF